MYMPRSLPCDMFIVCAPPVTSLCLAVKYSHKKSVNFLVGEKKTLGDYNISTFIFHHISIKGFLLPGFWG